MNEDGQLALREESNVVEQATSIMDVIERASRDPAVDVEKLGRLLEMYDRIAAQRAKAAYTQAMVSVKPKLPVIDRRGRIEIKAKGTETVIQSTGYARWEDIDEKITPILTQHGLVLTFRSGMAQDGKLTVTGVLSHKDGHSEETTMTLPHDSTGSKNSVQAVGSSMSYGKRYTATLLLNIRTKGEDDDGQKGGDSTALVSDDQIQTLKDLLARSKGSVEKFCAAFKIEAIRDLPASRYSEAVERINLRGVKSMSPQ